VTSDAGGRQRSTNMAFWAPACNFSTMPAFARYLACDRCRSHAFTINARNIRLP
jgi:hypothetical protein